MALDKESKTLGKKQYHIHLKPGDIGKYVLLPIASRLYRISI